MNRRIYLVWLLVILVMALACGGMLLSMANSQLPREDWQTFSARREALREAPLQGKWRQSGRQTIFITHWAKENAENLGGVFPYEADGVVRVYAKGADEALQARLLEEAWYSDGKELELCPCDYSLAELSEALEALDAYLEQAPASVRESVQLGILMPAQNRVAIWVTHWSALDQYRLAKALGPAAGRCVLIREDLDQVLPQLEFVSARDWFRRDEEGNLVGESAKWLTTKAGGSNDPLDWPVIKEWKLLLSRSQRHYADNLSYCPDEGLNWRAAGVGSAYTLDGSELSYSCFLLTSRQRRWTGKTALQDSMGGTVGWPDEESYAYYQDWGRGQERIYRAVLRDAADCPAPIVVIYGY